MLTSGWLCPRCDHVNAPSERHCARCAPVLTLTRAEPPSLPGTLTLEQVTALYDPEKRAALRCRCPGGVHAHILDARLIGECPTARNGEGLVGPTAA